MAKKDVVRQSKERCSYRCPYYQDGAVLSLCNKYGKQLRYDGKIPPLLTDACKAELLTHNAEVSRSAPLLAQVGSTDGLCSSAPKKGDE